MERESAKAHRLCPVGISLCLSCLATEAAARAVGQGLLLMAPHREAGLRLTPPSGPWELLPVWGPNGSIWVRSCAYGFSVWGPLQALQPSSPLPSPHSSSLPGCLLLTPPFLCPPPHPHSWCQATGAHGAGGRSPVPMLSLGDLSSPPPGPALPNLCPDHPLAICGMTLFSLALACPPSLPSLGRAGVVSRPASLQLPQFLPGSFSSLQHSLSVLIKVPLCH